MTVRRKHSVAEEPTLVPEAVDWNGPLCRVLCCSNDVEKTMRPPNPFFLSALTPLRLWTYTISGYVDYEEGGRTTRIGPGTVLAVPQPGRGSLIYRKPGLPWRRIYIGIEGAAAVDIFDHVIQRYGHVHELPKQSEAVRVARDFCKMVEEEPKRSPQFWSVEAYRWLNAWWGSCRESVPSVRELLDIEGGPSQLIGLSHGSVKAFAEKMGYSRSYLSRRLKKIWNRNPSEVLREKRFEEARRLLRETRVPVGEVALKAGFGSSSSFCAAFKTRFGQTPLQYRHEKLKL
ncbi:MAG: helix-turn-helix transcriptional regulator [Akkermansiaceae bacterium]|jgi:AraC-like DNA-binding protein|nr:helix-turn-helix transcriptional regulator [Akkermansiaceae bacterium]MDP4780473.1 helix-turn-helix transcriptional regulator [Akkermansiaceae bacterium]